MVGAATLTRLRAIAPVARRASRVVATLVAVAAASANAESLVVSVGCRDGSPNGAYELRGADGRLRVAGALSKGRRTGTFIFWNAKGARVAVIPYDNGQIAGTVALWHAPRRASGEGVRKLEAPYVGGRRNGITRSWYDSGRPRAELRYEDGALAEAQAWRADGSALADADARALAERDAVADAATFADLEGLVAANQPACDDGARTAWPPSAVPDS